MELTQASKQHASRPADERFTSLHDLHCAAQYMRDNSTRRVMANRQLTAPRVKIERTAGQLLAMAA